MIMNFVQQDGLNFLLKSHSPTDTDGSWVGSVGSSCRWCGCFDGCWRLFTDIDLSDAQSTHSDSRLFLREAEGRCPPLTRTSTALPARDGIVGACGRVTEGQVLQVKESIFAGGTLGDPRHASVFQNGSYVTLRLTSANYRFTRRMIVS